MSGHLRSHTEGRKKETKCENKHRETMLVVVVLFLHQVKFSNEQICRHLQLHVGVELTV